MWCNTPVGFEVALSTARANITPTHPQLGWQNSCEPHPAHWRAGPDGAEQILPAGRAMAETMRTTATTTTGAMAMTMPTATVTTAMLMVMAMNGEDDGVDDDGAGAADDDGHDEGDETDEEVRARRRAELLSSCVGNYNFFYML